MSASLISIKDLSKEQVINILNLAQEIKQNKYKPQLYHKIIGSCFFEPSTRTRLSFEVAIKKMGGEVVGFSDADSTSATKGESFVDSIRVIASYVNALVIRHPADGAARLAGEVCGATPIINAGDGANQHPTQTVLDLFTIRELFSTLDGISIGVMGDLKHSRTIHSLVSVASLFNIQLYFISPLSLRIPEYSLFTLKQSRTLYSFHNDIEDVIDKLDVLYMTRIQKERFLADEFIPSNSYQITLRSLKRARKHLKILHPLPRQIELPVEIDNTSFAYYFTQAQNGIYVRQAVLDFCIN